MSDATARGPYGSEGRPPPGSPGRTTRGAGGWSRGGGAGDDLVPVFYAVTVPVRNGRTDLPTLQSMTFSTHAYNGGIAADVANGQEYHRKESIFGVFSPSTADTGRGEGRRPVRATAPPPSPPSEWITSMKLGVRLVATDYEITTRVCLIKPNQTINKPCGCETLSSLIRNMKFNMAF